MEMGEQLYLDSNIKYCDLKDFLKAQFVIFRCQNMWKYVKKGYMERGEQLYLEPWKSAPGFSILHYCHAIGKLILASYAMGNQPWKTTHGENCWIKIT